jgi:hypothetical protein
MGIETEGYFQIQPFENLLLIRSFGFWDGRVASAFARKAGKAISAHYQGRSWSVLHDGRTWELGTPEIEEIIPQMMMTPFTGTLTHHALVTGDSEIKQWQVTRMFSSLSVSYEHRVFQDLEAAAAWLKSAGYAVPVLGE